MKSEIKIECDRKSKHLRKLGSLFVYVCILRDMSRKASASARTAGLMRSTTLMIWVLAVRSTGGTADCKLPQSERRFVSRSVAPDATHCLLSESTLGHFIVSKTSKKNLRECCSNWTTFCSRQCLYRFLQNFLMKSYVFCIAAIVHFLSSVLCTVCSN